MLSVVCCIGMQGGVGLPVGRLARTRLRLHQAGQHAVRQTLLR